MMLLAPSSADVHEAFKCTAAAQISRTHADINHSLINDDGDFNNNQVTR